MLKQNILLVMSMGRGLDIHVMACIRSVHISLRWPKNSVWLLEMFWDTLGKGEGVRGGLVKFARQWRKQRR